MKKLQGLFCVAIIITALVSGAATANRVHANSLNPLALLDVNGQPAVATDSSDNITITWGYLGLGNIPGILAKRYNSAGTPIDNVGFWVSSPFAAPSLLNYDPDIATDSSGNSIIAWCAYEFSSPAKNIQVVYKKVSPPNATSSLDAASAIRAISPQQDEINLLNIPFAPVVAVDSSDNIAIAWNYYDFESGENGILLTVISSSGTAIDPVTVVSNVPETTTTNSLQASSLNGSGKGTVGVTPSQTTPTATLYYAPAIAFDGEGNIVITYTGTGMLPFFEGEEGGDIPLTAVFYSKYTTSGSVVTGYDKQTIAIGLLSTVEVDSSGNMIIAWNTFDIFTLKVRIMSAIYPADESSARKVFEVGVRPDIAPSAFVDTGDNFFNMGIAIAADSEDNFFVAWGGSNFFGSHIYFKEIYSDGYYLSNEVQVSQGFDLNYVPSIATDSQGNVIIAWNRFSLADLFTGAFSVYARRFDNDLQALDDEFKVNISY